MSGVFGYEDACGDRERLECSYSTCDGCPLKPGEYENQLQDELAALKEQMESLVTVLRKDHNIEASWDSVRRFWYIGLTQCGAKVVSKC